MRMIVCLATSIPARWFSIGLLLAGTAAGAPAPSVAAQTAAATRLGQGINAYNNKDYSGAIAAMRGLDRQIPKLYDYVTYYLGSSEMQTGDSESAVRDLAAYRTNPTASSPLAGKIGLIEGRALLDRKQGSSNEKALRVLQTDYKLLPQPDGDFAIGLAYEALGEKPQAALAYSKVYYAYPNTDLAQQAWTAMERLRAALGRDFPPAPAGQQLERCQKWLNAGKFVQARQEYESLAGSLPAPGRDEAKVGVGVAEYHSGATASALRYLKDLKVARGETDAKRLYFVTEAARKAQDDPAMAEAVRQLAERYAQSPWRLKALISAGNRYVLTNDRENYTRYFEEASDAFASDVATAYPHWRVVWDAWLDDKPSRIDLLREQIERYPSDSRAGSALYFLGRASEQSSRYAEARAYYDFASSEYPHYFYGVLSREKLSSAKISAAKADPAVKEWLDAIEWPSRADFSSTEPNAATKLRVERARLLMQAGMADLADAELRFGAQTGTEQPHLLALELARSVPSPFQALRIMKSFGSDYLAVPFENAPLRFWQMLFPLPYRDDVNRNAKDYELDPYSVAALIRQETEFNPAARSPKNAYGLMQLMPPTGRQLARQVGIPISSNRSLLDPSTSIALGTRYLRQQLNTWDGDWTQTLAAYNAGPSRVKEWRGWSRYREPAEFVENIPFTETREYVQAVLRNADMYRKIYGERHPAAADVRDPYDVPPVNLASLPLAARTPGGGLRTASKNSPAAVRRPAKPSRVSGKRPAARKSTAGRPKPAAKRAPA